jgi:hypothetical protein
MFVAAKALAVATLILGSALGHQEPVCKNKKERPRPTTAAAASGLRDGASFRCGELQRQELALKVKEKSAAVNGSLQSLRHGSRQMRFDNIAEARQRQSLGLSEVMSTLLSIR